MGYLGLDAGGSSVGGILRMAADAPKAGSGGPIIPAANASEAGLVPGVTVRGAETLRQVIEFVRAAIPLLTPPTVDESSEDTGPDLADVLGQERGRFALELAAAGRHHLAMFGSPGAGKT